MSETLPELLDAKKLLKFGFVEAGLTSILVLAGVDSDQAVVATLLYRLVSFWLPIPLGALAWAGWRFTAGQQGRPMT